MKLVAHAQHRLQTFAVVAELPAQVQSVRVDGAPAACVAIAPDAREQLLPGEDAVDPLDEETEELKFVGRQLEGLVVPVSLPHLAVEHDLAIPQLQRRAGSAVARLELPEPGRELLQRDGRAG